MRMLAIVVLSAERKQNGEARAAPGRRLDLDAAAMGSHDAAGDGEAEASAPGLLRVEGLEDPAALLHGQAAPRVADGDGHPRLAEADGDLEPPASVHRLDAVERDVPHHL